MEDEDSLYFVYTWDAELQKFTPQIGVSEGPYTQFGLRKALHELRELGYRADRDDSWTLVRKGRLT